MMRKFTIIGVLLALIVLVGPSLSQDQVTLRVMHWNQNLVDGTPWWDEIIQGFEDTHPGVTVESNFVPFAQYLTTLASMAAGDELPDVFFGHVKAAELGRAGLAVDYTQVFDQDFLDQFYPGPMRQFTFDGAVYALPWSAQIFGVFVNDRIMDELGLTYPETWDELIEMTPTIKEAGYEVLVWGNLARNVCPDFFLPLVTQYGGDVYALDDLTAEGVTWDSEPVINALALLQRLSQAGVFLDGINGIDDNLSQQMVFQDRAVMRYSGSWRPAEFEDQGSQDWLDNYSVQKQPTVNAGEIHWTGDGSGEGWVTAANNPNKDLALEFVQYLFSLETYDKWIAGANSFPSMPAAVDQVTNEKVLEMLTWMPTDGSDHILFGAGSWDAVSNVCSGILDGTIEPADGATQIQAAVLETRAQAVSQ
jgi:raffinose/stachyose/melibiose transport system substrate-binding protein